MMASTAGRGWSVSTACALLLVLGVAATAHAVPLSFTPGSAPATGVGPVATAAGDLDGDGLADLVTANYLADTLSIIRSNVSAPGTFLPAVGYPVAAGPIDIGIADLNLDGVPDFAVISCSCEGPLTIFLGNASAPGTFLAHQPYALASEPYALAIADLNGDGLPDLAISSDFDNDVTILLGDINAPGTFLAGVSYPVGNAPGHVRVGDFNNDGVADLAISVLANDFAPDAVAVLFGNVSVPGTFGAPVLFPTGPGPDSLVVGDFNGDGVLDLAVGTRDPGLATAAARISVLLGNVSAPGAFGAYVEYDAGSSEYGLAVGDLSGDAKLSLVVADGDTNRINVLRGPGNGTFYAPLLYAAGSLPASPVIADLDGDGRPDIAAVNMNSDNVTTLLNTTSFVPRIRFSAATYSAGRESTRTITVLRSNGLGLSVTVDYAASDGSATVSDGDYVATSGTLSFGPMETSKTFQLPVLRDGITEDAETINLTLSNPTGGAVLGNRPTAVLTIAANDASVVQFSRATWTTAQKALLHTITVIRRHLGTEVTVEYATSDGTATEGQDYTATSGVLTFGANDYLMSFQVPILQSPRTEAKTVNLTLSNPGVGAFIGPRGTAELTIPANQ